MSHTAVPISPTAPPPGDPASAFRGKISPIRPSLLYQFGLFLVALVTFALPLAYLALIAVVGYAIYWHASENLFILTETSRGYRAAKARVVGYVGPIVGGLVLLFFMVKPLLARAAEREEPLSLDASQEPRLFAFINALCQAMGAPAPRRIDIDSDVNASASFRRGFASFFGKDLVLTIGLPLVAGLSVEQLTGVIAHEFGHFTQGVGMRLSYLIRRVSDWLARVAYVRDAWDLWLRESASDPEGNSLLRMFLYLCILFVWVTRLVLKLLVLVGNMAGCFMLRRMEYNADRHEAAVVGADVFESTTHQIVMLDVARHFAIADLEKAWKERRLADNLPRMIALKAASIPDRVREKIASGQKEQAPGFFSTHPGDAARIANARKHAVEPIFACSGPATMLFANFKMIAHAVTLSFYRDVVGLEVDRENLVPAEGLVAERTQANDVGKAAVEYFAPGLIPQHPLLLQCETIGPPQDARKTALQVKAAKQKLEQAAPKIKSALELAFKAYRQLDDCAAASALAAAKVSFNPALFRVKSDSLKSIEAETLRARDQSISAGRILDVANALRRARLVAAIQLLHVSAVRSRLKQADDHLRELQPLIAAHARLEAIAPHWKTLMADVAVLIKILESAPSETELMDRFPKLKGAARSYGDRVRMALDDIKAALATDSYPFPHAAGRVTIAQVIFDLGQFPATGASLLSSARAGYTVNENLLGLRERIMHRLATMAKDVETALFRSKKNPETARMQ